MTKEQWLNKIKGFLPSWFWQNQQVSIALFAGIAKALETVDEMLIEHRDQTFITRSKGEYLDIHGHERDVKRIPGELDQQYAVRVQNIRNQSNLPAIKKIVDKFLIRGECAIKEDYDTSMFFGDVYFNRGDMFLDHIHNCFSIVVDKQVTDPYSFFSRDYFFDRETFMSTHESSDYVFDLILTAVNDAKALGTVYRIIERLEAY